MLADIGVQAARGILAGALDLVYPPRCVSCGHFGRGFLCTACEARLVPAAGPGVCPNCSAPWDGDDFCPDCHHWDALDGARAAYRHEGPARQLVHALKYRHAHALGPTLASPMAGLLASQRVDFVLPVPLHRQRLRSRGFNQAAVIAAALQAPRPPGLLWRTRNTGSQVGLALAARRANVRGAFEYRGPPMPGARIALIDDVLTTGATANECASVLKRAGAARVVAITFARAMPPSKRHPTGGDS